MHLLHVHIEACVLAKQESGLWCQPAGSSSLLHLIWTSVAAQEELIQACINGGNLRDACLLVKEWNLTADFPNLESQYQQRTMQRLLGKALWGAAAGYAIGKPAFQVPCASA